MIFVTVGSSAIPFDRLLRAVDELEADEEVVVQHGASSIRPRGAACVDFMGFDEFVRAVRRARVVVTHAGVGSIMTARAECKRPVVVPRRRSLGEAVDDHQVAFARRAAELGLVTVVEGVDLLTRAIADHAAGDASPLTARSPIELELRSYIEECVGGSAPRTMTGDPAACL